MPDLDAEFVEPWVEVAVEVEADMLLLSVAEVLADVDAVPVVLVLDDATEPEADASAFVPVPVVDAEALIPEFADVPEVLLVFRVLLQFTNSMARGSTRNVFFIKWSFYYLHPIQNSAKNEKEC
ncbi:hypothetical protein [Segetibacter aerophilus]|uniref:Uncharacterized protein n=1 Tax=Segetibacter aerophilus TaxID=670293 RepID=A0A512BJP5_9BACT|nr:hypothetical protein [Segetibacter aerophilus]GEO12189.1 hypothetical protein SAE01_46850 [Segetibacter aerophilus]